VKKFVYSLVMVSILLSVILVTGCQKKEEFVDPETLEVQLIPSRDAAYLDAQRLPLQQLLEAQLDKSVNVTVATDYNALIEGMASEQIHVGLLATTAYVLAADGHQLGKGSQRQESCHSFFYFYIRICMACKPPGGQRSGSGKGCGMGQCRRSR